MLKFQDILEEQTKAIYSREPYLEFWDNCILNTLKNINSKNFDFTSLQNFINFFLTGLEHKKLLIVFNQEYIKELILDVIKAIDKPYNIFTILQLYEKGMDFTNNLYEKMELFNTYNYKLSTSMQIDKNIKEIIIKIDQIERNFDKDEYKKILQMIEKYILDNVDIYCKEELELVIRKSFLLISASYHTKNFKLLFWTVNIIKKINDELNFNFSKNILSNPIRDINLRIKVTKQT